MLLLALLSSASADDMSAAILQSAADMLKVGALLCSGMHVAIAVNKQTLPAVECGYLAALQWFGLTRLLLQKQQSMLESNQHLRHLLWGDRAGWCKCTEMKVTMLLRPLPSTASDNGA